MLRHYQRTCNKCSPEKLPAQPRKHFRMSTKNPQTPDDYTLLVLCKAEIYCCPHRQSLSDRRKLHIDTVSEQIQMIHMLPNITHQQC